MQLAKTTSLLRDLGLSQHEAQIYLASLSLGPATVLRLAAAAEVKRTTVYSIVQNLRAKGLISVEVKGLKKLYAPEPPAKLEAILEVRHQELRETLPELSGLFNLKGGQSLIRYYEGLAGTKRAYELALEAVDPKDDYLVISNEQSWMELDQVFFTKFIEQRAKKMKQPVRMLFQDSSAARRVQKFQKNYNASVKLLPAKTNLTTNLVITPQRVIIQQLIQPIITIVIENQSVIQMHKEMFEIIWRALPG